MSAKRVVFLSESQGWSGGAKQLLRLAEGLGPLGWDVTVACPGDGEAYRRAGALGLKTIDLHPREDYDVVSALRLARLLERGHVDILHAHHPRAHAVGLMAAYLSRHRSAFVVTRRVSFKPGLNPLSRLKYRSRRIDGYIAVAESIRQGLIDAGVEPGRVVAIPSGVDLADFSPRPKDEALAAELELPACVPVIGKIANSGSWKGQEVALEAAARLKAMGRRLVFLFAGRDTAGPALRAKAKELGLGDADARFLGFRDDVPRVLSLLSLSLNAAVDGEGLSGALRESMAMEIPVAASDAGGNGELVQDGVTGRLFPAGNAEALAKAVAGQLDDAEGARRMAMAARKLVSDRYGAERLASATANFYRSVLARRLGSVSSAASSEAHASSTATPRQDSQAVETTL